MYKIQRDGLICMLRGCAVNTEWNAARGTESSSGQLPRHRTAQPLIYSFDYFKTRDISFGQMKKSIKYFFPTRRRDKIFIALISSLVFFFFRTREREKGCTSKRRGDELLASKRFEGRLITAWFEFGRWYSLMEKISGVIFNILHVDWNKKLFATKKNKSI